MQRNQQFVQDYELRVASVALDQVRFDLDRHVLFSEDLITGRLAVFPWVAAAGQCLSVQSSGLRGR